MQSNVLSRTSVHDAWANTHYTLERSTEVDFLWNLYDESTNKVIDSDKSRTVILARNNLVLDQPVKRKMIYSSVDHSFSDIHGILEQDNHNANVWQLRDYATRKIIDRDQYRNDIAERNNLKLIY